MIACTKLFAIDEVRLVIFKGALNFIILPLLVEKRPVSVARWQCCRIYRLSLFASRYFVVYERGVAGRLIQRFDPFAATKTTTLLPERASTSVSTSEIGVRIMGS